MSIMTNLRSCMIDLKSCTVWHYSIVEEEIYQAELGEYRTYGIRITTPEYADILHDVSVCKKTVEEIVELLNHYHVSPVHLCDIVTDTLFQTEKKRFRPAKNFFK